MQTLDSRVMDGAQTVVRARTSIASDSFDAEQSLLNRTRFLDPKDAMLLEQVLKGNLSLRELSTLIGADAGTISRRVTRIMARLRDPIVLAVTDDRCPLAPDYRQLAIEHFLRGLSATELADLHQMNLRAVREMLSYVRGWHKGITAAATLLARRD